MYYFNKSYRIKRKNAGKILLPKIFSISSRLDFILLKLRSMTGLQICKFPEKMAGKGSIFDKGEN